jgi:hypothetical protein
VPQVVGVQGDLLCCMLNPRGVGNTAVLQPLLSGHVWCCYHVCSIPYAWHVGTHMVSTFHWAGGLTCCIVTCLSSLKACACKDRGLFEGEIAHYHQPFTHHICLTCHDGTGSPCITADYGVQNRQHIWHLMSRGAD